MYVLQAQGFWDVVEKLIQRGCTADTAIDHIYLVYGIKKSNMQILNAMRKDKMEKTTGLRDFNLFMFAFMVLGLGGGHWHVVGDFCPHFGGGPYSLN